MAVESAVAVDVARVIIVAAVAALSVDDICRVCERVDGRVALPASALREETPGNREQTSRQGLLGR